MSERVKDEFVNEVLAQIIKSLEANDDIVVISSVDKVVEEISGSIFNNLPHVTITSSELSALASLAYHAINDKRFFDQEMPSLTGFTVEDFERTIEKLPKV